MMDTETVSETLNNSYDGWAEKTSYNKRKLKKKRKRGRWEEK
jgi:hypothetical protein